MTKFKLEIEDVDSTKLLFKSLTGLTEEEATEKLKEMGLTSRICSLEGEPMVGTRDYRTDRLNFWIVDGKISKIEIG